jgi:hypothetical protein
MPNLFSPVLDWLLNHLVALAFMGFFAVAIFARGPLFGIEGSLDGAAAVSTQAPDSVPDAPSDQPVIVEDTRPPTVTVELATAQQDAQKPQKPLAVDESVFRPTEPVSGDHQQFVPLDVVKQAKRAELGVQAKPVSGAELERMLQAARTAFWKGALERAESLYLRYLSANPTNANVFGELGNLYQSMGRSQDALDAYFEAGVRFKSMGDREQLMQIIELLADARDSRVDMLRHE